LSIPVKTGQLAANAWWLGPRLAVDRISTFPGSSYGFDRLFPPTFCTFLVKVKSLPKKNRQGSPSHQGSPLQQGSPGNQNTKYFFMLSGYNGIVMDELP